MDPRRKFSKGDWIDAPKGIGQVEEVNPVYCEENDARVAEGEKAVGDLDNIVVIYKIFCGFDHKIKHDDRWNYATNSACHRIDGKTKKIINAMIAANPADYQRYEADTDNGWMGQTWLFDGLIRPEFFNKYREKCEEIEEELGSEFDLTDFQNCLYKHSMPIPIAPEPSIRFDDKGNLRLSIFNKLFRTKKKRAVYTKFSYELLDVYDIRPK